MRTILHYGLASFAYDVASERLVEPRRKVSPAALSDPRAAVRAALESPNGYPALRKALTPDDHVVVLVDENLPHIAALLSPVLEQIVSAGVATANVTLLCPPSASSQRWLEELPEEYEEARLEIHDPADRRHLSYLATTKQGRRIYLNRTAVDADQLVMLTGRRYDPHLGVSGCEGALYPGVSDEATLRESGNQLALAAPEMEPWPARREAAEVCWLLGAPYVVQIIEGEGDGIAHVVAGPVDSSSEGQRLLDEIWHVHVSSTVETVVASVSGDPGRCAFADLAAAFANASRAVGPGGKIILLTAAKPDLSAATAILREAEDPQQALTLLAERNPPDRAAGFQWASAAAQARLYLLSALPTEAVEDMFATPLDDAAQVQRLLQGDGTVLFLQDAHKAMVEVEEHRAHRLASKVGGKKQRTERRDR